MPTKLIRPILFLLAHSTKSELSRQIQFLKAENEILRAKLPNDIRTTSAERKRLLKLGKPLGSSLKNLISIVVYSTFLHWLREDEDRLGKASGSVGRPRKPEELRALIVRLAEENGWGYTRILGELKKLGITSVSRTTIKNILKEHGLDPSPNRGEGSCDAFLKRHAETLWACDFFSKKVWTKSGLVDCFVLFYIHVATRCVHIAGVTTNPNRAWLAQQARNASIFFNDQPRKAEFLIHDADGKFTPRFIEILKSDGIEQVRLPIRSPNLNAFEERWVQSIKHECLNDFIVFGETHMRYLVEEYAAHYHAERPHQALGNRPLGSTATTVPTGDIACRNRLGGLLKNYYRKAG